MKLIFAFGLSFQLPVALTLMGRVGLVTSEQLARNRKFAIVGVFVVAAIITPPDVISQVSLAIPILCFTRSRSSLVRIVERRRAEAEAAEAAADAAASTDSTAAPEPITIISPKLMPSARVI